MNNYVTRAFLMLFIAGMIFTGCQKDETERPEWTAEDYASDVSQRWIALSLELTRTTPGYSPPVASRAFGYSGLALYESVRGGMPGYKSLAGEVNQLPATPDADKEQAYHWPSVANAALAYMFRNLYANTSADNLAAIDALEAELYASAENNPDSDVLERSKAHGIAVATVVYEYSKNDGGHEGYTRNFPTDYQAPTGAGMWVPTAPGMLCLQPYWGTCRPFVARHAVGVAVAAPKPYSTDPLSTFYAQALEVYSITANLTPEEETIARYWSDDPGATATPPGHSMSVLAQILKKENASLGEAAEAYAKLGMGVADAFIVCWRTKYQYNLVRPVSYINDVIDPNWTPILSTPPFPEYTSGHSVQSGATARVLSDLFGYNYAFTDNTHQNRTDIDGSPRSYTSFNHFAEEAAVSRLYGGIHYRDAIDLGVDQGKTVGANISNLRFK